MINRSAQHGMTLVEIMIAMTLSLVIISGVGTVYMSSKRTYENRSQLSEMEDSARVALEMLTKNLEHAGYASAQKLPIGSYFYVSGDSNPVAVACGGGFNLKDVTDLTPRPTRDALNKYGDSISIRFVGDSTLYTDAANGTLANGCWAGAAPSVQATLIYNAFHVDDDGSTKDSLGNYIPILYAVGSTVNNRQPVVNGIENIQFMYGIDTDGNGSADQYLNATDVSAAAAWRQVVSIKVALLARSLEPVLPTATAQDYTLLDVKTSYNDRYQRAVFSTVIQLRNVVDG